MLAPGCDGIRLVEPEAERDELPQLLDVGLAQDLAGPAPRRRPDAAPVDAVLPVHPPGDLRRLERNRATDALAVEVGQQLRLRIPRRPQLGVARRGPRPCVQPLGRVGERLVGPELDHRASDVLVLVPDVDVGRPGPVRLPRQRADELSMLDEPADEDLLARLHVRADADRKLCVPLEPLAVVAHASCHSSPRISGTSVPSASTASTSSSDPPTMKSTCMFATLSPSPGSSSKRNGKPAP